MTRAEQWRTVARFTGILGPLAALVGIVPGYFLGDGSAASIGTGALIGFLIGTGMVAFEVSWGVGLISRSIREAPFLAVIAAKSVSWLAIIVIGLAFPIVIIAGEAPTELLTPSFAVSIGISFAIALGINFIIQLNQLMGPGILLRLILGRYHRPREETRIFLFIDLRGSTAVAEKLGNLEYHRLLRRFIADITPSVVRTGGEIHRYVGDQVIVTWTRRAGLMNAACVRSVFMMTDALEQARGRYLESFGMTPSFWAGLHIGEVVTGEIGAIKHEIVYLGDTMNETARIEQACQEFDRPFVASAEIVSALTLPDGIAAESLGAVPLRGVSEPLELYALARI